MTYIDGLKAAEAACHDQREQCLRDRREAKVERDKQSEAYAAAEALAVWMCIERIQALIQVAQS